MIQYFGTDVSIQSFLAHIRKRNLFQNRLLMLIQNCSVGEKNCEFESSKENQYISLGSELLKPVISKVRFLKD